MLSAQVKGADQVCDLHDVETPCSTGDVCCDYCSTYGHETNFQMLLAAILGTILLVLFGLAIS